jgi:cyclophilin family peptidyl-prolyl cis-trans isomerase
MTIDPARTYSATIDTSAGQMTAELFAAEAPKTVNNFVFLARDGFYDGVIFHRVIRGFMIQGGDPTGTGSGGPGYRFDDEPVTRRYSRGILAMANAGRNTNGSQFFVMHADYGLPPNYTIFGRLTAGEDVLDKIATAQTGAQDRPVAPVTINKVTITEA